MYKFDQLVNGDNVIFEFGDKIFRGNLFGSQSDKVSIDRLLEFGTTARRRLQSFELVD